MKSVMTIGAVLAISALAFGGASITLTQHESSATAISVAPGASFAIDVRIDQDDAEGCGAFNFALRCATSGIFKVTARGRLLSDFLSASDDSAILPASVNESTNYNLGGLHSSSYWPASDFPQVVMELTMTADASATPGVYTVYPGTAIWGLPVISVKDDKGMDNQTPLTIGVLTLTVQGDSGGGGGGGDGDEDTGGDDTGDEGGGDAEDADDESDETGESDDAGTVDPDGGDPGQDTNGGSSGEDDNAQEEVLPPPSCGSGVGGAFVLATMLGLGLIGYPRRRD